MVSSACLAWARGCLFAVKTWMWICFLPVRQVRYWCDRNWSCWKACRKVNPFRARLSEHWDHGTFFCMYFILYFMGRQQPGSACRSVCECQVWSRQGGCRHQGWQQAGVSRERQWGFPLRHQGWSRLEAPGRAVRIPSGAPGKGNEDSLWSTRCCSAWPHLATGRAGISGNCSSCCSPAACEQLQLTWPWLSTAHPLSHLCWRMAAHCNHLFLSLEVIYGEELLEGRWFIAYQ